MPEVVPRSQAEICQHWTKGHSEPLVSICCATFNHEGFIGKAIDSMLAQETDFAFEILVHDDASLDGTPEILERYEKNYPGILRVVRQSENQWSKGHRIFAEFLMPVARGRYIALCEGDDYWRDPTKLQKQVDFLESNPEFVICYADCEGVHEGERVDHAVSGVRWDLSPAELQAGPALFTLTVCFRNVIDSWPLELSRGRYGDILLWSLLGNFGAGRYMSDIEPSAYRMHASGLHSMQSQTRRLEMALETYMVLFLYRMRIGEKTVALRHLQDVVVLSFKLERGRLLRGVAARAWKKLRRKWGV